MADPSVHLVVFSKDRPLQLHGYLTSLFRHWRGDVRVDVLIHDNDATPHAYEDIRTEFGALPVHLTYEEDFPEYLDIELDEDSSDAPYTCFGCDDVVFTQTVDVDDIDAAFRGDPKLLGFSLRLGKHIERDMFGRPMPHPPFLPDGYAPFDEYGVGMTERGLLWDVGQGVGDWGYPWEVLGTVYPADYVRRTVRALVADGLVQNPSTLEDAGWRRWAAFAEGRYKFRSFARSRLVVPTVNVVQSVFGNGIVGGAGLDPAFLLDCWDRGLRLDTERYRGVAPPSWRVGDFYLRRGA